MPRGFRKVVAAFGAGALMVSSAWAGASLMPVPGEDTVQQATDVVAPPAQTSEPSSRTTSPAATPTKRASAPSAASLPAGQVLAGAAKTSIRPRPADYGGTWETDPAKCRTLSEDAFSAAMEDPVATGDHLASTGSPWPENPNCIYMGGFSIGPMNPVSSWNDDLGLWVRAIALRDRDGDDLVLVVVDGEGWFWDYAKKCEDCGSKQLSERLAAESDLGLEAEDVVIAATHAHSSPDFIGGWGFVPDWYMKQVADTIMSTVRTAVGRMRPAVLEYGERTARAFNHERRGTYRSAEEQQLAWLRAYEPAATRGTEPTARKRSRRRRTKSKPPPRPKTIATLGAYAAHPTTFGTNDGEAHPDWPGLFEKSLEQRFGGIGLHFMTGLGNMSASGLDHSADDLAGLVADIGAGNRVDGPDIRTKRSTWTQPVTNVPLTALGVPGFFDRQFIDSPSSVQTGKDGGVHCASSGPTSAEVAASAARIGDELALSASPGEIFSNASNTLKEQSKAPVTFPLGQANDALGYMPQSFELNPVGQQGLGFAVNGFVFVNYEDSYAIDRCFGDMALETSIGLLGELAKP
ncbi:MAG TPA: hypothetical protein VF587_18480 [Solirubrobacteraceae bacterium]|jgi:hypothetical protein